MPLARMPNPQEAKKGDFHKGCSGRALRERELVSNTMEMPVDKENSKAIEQTQSWMYLKIKKEIRATPVLHCERNILNAAYWE